MSDKTDLGKDPDNLTAYVRAHGENPGEPLTKIDFYRYMIDLEVKLEARLVSLEKELCTNDRKENTLSPVLSDLIKILVGGILVLAGAHFLGGSLF